MKISTLEKILLCCAGAAVLLAAGYFLGQRSAAPYHVSVDYPAPTQAPATSPVPISTPAPTGKININTAAASDLQGLPGIGERRAEDIVQDRVENGPFKTVEDITRVKGVGEGTLTGLLDYITVE